MGHREPLTAKASDSGLRSDDSQGGQQETSFLLAPPIQPARKGAVSKKVAITGPQRPLVEVWDKTGTLNPFIPSCLVQRTHIPPFLA